MSGDESETASRTHDEQPLECVYCHEPALPGKPVCAAYVFTGRCQPRQVVFAADVRTGSCQRCEMDVAGVPDDDGHVVCSSCGSQQLLEGRRLLRKDVGRRWGLPVTFRLGQHALIEKPDMRGRAGRIEHLVYEGEGTDESPLFLVASVRLFQTLPNGAWGPSSMPRVARL